MVTVDIYLLMHSHFIIEFCQVHCRTIGKVLLSLCSVSNSTFSCTDKLHMIQCGNLCWLHIDSSCEAGHLKHLLTIRFGSCAAAALLVEGLMSLQGMQLQISSACKHTHATHPASLILCRRAEVTLKNTHATESDGSNCAY